MTESTGVIKIEVDSMRTATPCAHASSPRSRGLPGTKAIETAALVAAATTTSSPEIVACKPVLGSYIFRADFTASR